MRRVRLFSKAGCHLCEAARLILDRLAPEFDLIVEELDIRSNPDWWAAYRNVIPVVEIEGGPIFSSKISEYRLRQALKGKSNNG
jgi:glutaredoxin